VVRVVSWLALGQHVVGMLHRDVKRVQPRVPCVVPGRHDRRHSQHLVGSHSNALDRWWEVRRFCAWPRGWGLGQATRGASDAVYFFLPLGGSGSGSGSVSTSSAGAGWTASRALSESPCGASIIG